MINEGDINNRGTVAGEMGDALLAVDLGVSLDACSVGGRGQGLMPYRMQKNMIVASFLACVIATFGYMIVYESKVLLCKRWHFRLF